MQKGVGVGVFYKPQKAVSADHNLTRDQVVGRVIKAVIPGEDVRPCFQNSGTKKQSVWLLLCLFHHGWFVLISLGRGDQSD